MVNFSEGVSLCSMRAERLLVTSVLTKDEGPGTTSIDDLERASAEIHQDAWLRSEER